MGLDGVCGSLAGEHLVAKYTGLDGSHGHAAQRDRFALASSNAGRGETPDGLKLVEPWTTGDR
jgi:hypothetical protein